MSQFTETWTGSNGTSWAGTWTSTLSGTGGIVDIQSNRGRVASPTSATFQAIVINDNTLLGLFDFDMTVRVNFPNPKIEQYITFVYRADAWSGDNVTNGFKVYMQPQGNIVVLDSYTGGVATNLASPSVTFTNGTDVWLRVQAIGNNHRVKVWDVSAGEPGSWNIDFLDSTQPPWNSSCFWGFGTLSSATGATVNFDDLTFNYPQWGNPALLRSIGTNSSNSTGTTLAVSYTGNNKPQVGDHIFVSFGRDNATNDPATGDSISDGHGNTYTPVEQASPPTTNTAAAGGVGGFFYSKLTTAWAGGTNTITWTHPSIAARAMRVDHVRGLLNVRSGTANTGHSTAGAPSAATTGTLEPGDFVWGATSFEHSTASTVTGDADTTNGSWAPVRVVTSAGTTLAAHKVATQFKTVTATGNQTYNPTNSTTTNVNAVSAVAAFVPLPQPNPVLRPAGERARGSTLNSMHY